MYNIKDIFMMTMLYRKRDGEERASTRRPYRIIINSLFRNMIKHTPTITSFFG